MATYIVLLGMPGAGKGTQAAIISKDLGLPHITSGGMFRELAGQDTELARRVREIMRRGDLVPDDLTVQIVRERLERPDAAGGAILDGFPRTVPQAEALDALLAENGHSVTVVPFFKLSKEEALARLGGRWICSKDPNHMYHTRFNPPKVPGVCDIDGAPLYQREDDTPEAHKQRIEVYMERTAPLIEYYRDRGLLVEINAEQPIEAVTAELMAAIKERIVENGHSD